MEDKSHTTLSTFCLIPYYYYYYDISSADLVNKILNFS